MANEAQDAERAGKSYWGDGILEEDQKKLDEASKSKDDLILESPIRLGYFAIFCLVVNRMVGKFRHPATKTAIGLILVQALEFLIQHRWCLKTRRASVFP